MTRGNLDLVSFAIKYLVISFGNPFSATGLGPRYTRENCWEGIYSRKFLSVENGAKAFAICYHTDGTEAQCVIIKEKKVLFADVFLPLVLQQLYLHGLHHKLSWSSPNKARHFFGVFASVSRTGRHKHTHRDNKTKKKRKENGHVIAQTKTCGQGLGSGWQHWDILHHYDQAIRHQILQAQTCQFKISDILQ